MFVSMDFNKAWRDVSWSGGVHRRAVRTKIHWLVVDQSALESFTYQIYRHMFHLPGNDFMEIDARNPARTQF